jgi:predicted transcriptional regulator
MAKNSLYDLNDHLFERIEWLTDREIKGEELAEEIKRSEAVVKVSTQILNNANLLLKAKQVADNANGKMRIPTMLDDKTK